MLLYSNSRLWPVALAVVIAISSKYIVRARIRGRVRHILNPSNIGISIVLIMFPWVGIAPPYEFTEWADGPVRWIIPVAILVSGTLLNLQLTKRMPLVVSWLGVFALQGVVRSLFFGAHLQTELLPMTGTAFVLFTNYMITDPGTSPSTTWRQVGFGGAVAATYGILVEEHVVFGLFFALTIISCLRAMLMVARAWADRRVPVTVDLRTPAQAQPDLVLVGPPAT
jgi:Na+-translocating ferredoxin:NAD+ oxidoreductase RnfD subunit